MSVKNSRVEFLTDAAKKAARNVLAAHPEYRSTIESALGVRFVSVEEGHARFVRTKSPYTEVAQRRQVGDVFNILADHLEHASTLTAPALKAALLEARPDAKIKTLKKPARKPHEKRAAR